MHLEAVVAVLVESGVTETELLAAGWLHDPIEDTGVSAEQIAGLAGERAATIVDARARSS